MAENEPAEFPKGYWLKVGVFGGLQVALVWGLTMWAITAADGEVDYKQLFTLAPCVGLFFGITFPLTMRWWIAKSQK